MARVKRGIIHLKKRRKLLKAAKGYKWGRKKLIKLARPAVLKAGAYAYRDRRTKKRDRRRLWNIHINAACRECGMTYSTFIAQLTKKHIAIDRKILSQLAENYPKLFSKLIERVKAST